MEKLVTMKGITKRFPGVIALEDIHFDLYKGEVHVVLGENGAGKSTLMKILSGVYQPDEGTIAIHDKELTSLTPKTSSENGVAIIYQELSSIDAISIYENIFVGRIMHKKVFGLKVVDEDGMKNRAKELLDMVGLNIHPSTFMSELSVSQKQLVEIAKAISTDSSIIIMDEPTSSLNVEETTNLFRIIRDLKKKGIGIIYISHKLNEIKQIGVRVTVLKDGKIVDTKSVDDVEIDDLIRMMVGRQLETKYKQHEASPDTKPEIVLKVENLTRADDKVRNVSFEMFKGEILGFAGLIGSGRTELMEAIFGAAKSRGTVTFNGKICKYKNTYDGIKNGIALLTENRRASGIFQNFEIWKNTSSSWLISKSSWQGLWGKTDIKQEKILAEQYCKKMGVKYASIHQNITELSGGNQQKVIIAKWLLADANLMIFDEPTRGIDVGAKSEIYNIMRELTESGKSIIVVSSELPELLMICDRIVVFKEGQIAKVLANHNVTEEEIITHAAHH